MNKIVVVLIAIAVTGLAGAGAYLTLSKQASKDTLQMDSQEQMQENENTSGQPNSLAELMALSANQQCTFVDADSNSSGTVYVGNGQMRGDFETSSDGDVMNSHMLTQDDQIYLWFDGNNEGFKASISEMSDIKSDDFDTNIFDPSESVSYDCSGWSVDNSKFNLPDGVEFVDYTSFMQDMQDAMEDLNMESMMEGDESPDFSSQCAACNSLPQDAQAQCKSALGCE